MIGRKSEQKYLLDAFNADSSRFVAVYGRRRIGKTFLVRETFGHKFTFQHSGAADKEKKVQLNLFRSSLKDAGHEACPVLKSWYDAFNELKVLVCKSDEKKKVIFLDEAAWMDTPKSQFLSALEFFWNNWASNRKDVLLIICASATSWIINKVFRDRGGLHNRITDKIALAPFTLKECELYAKEMGLNFTRYQILGLYMIMGGVALYWSLLNGSLSPVQNVDYLFFNKDARLSGEFNDLYDSLFKNSSPYKEIVSCLGKNAQGLTRAEIITKAKQADNGALTERLEELEECGFILKMRPFPYKKKEAVYKLIDNYSIFYFKYLKENAGINSFWLKNFNSSSVQSWSGFAFERVCLQHIEQIKRAMGISAVMTTEHSWRCVPSKDEKQKKGAQIDLLIDRRDGVLNVCEMKWSAGEFTISKAYDAELRNKIAVLRAETLTKKAVHITMITTYGVSHNAYYNSIQSEVTLDQLFEQ